jgi:HlyD family secretion protein
MPGMTATIGIEIWTANDVLRIPSAALRYRPVDDVFSTFGQPVPPEAHVRLGSPAPVAAVPARAGAATPLRAGSTIDVFFQAVPRPDAPGQVWVKRDHKLTPLAVHVGVTDGTWTELLAGGLVAGDEVVTNVVLPAQAHRPAATSANSLMPPSRGAPPPRATGR